jgi:carbonic anhydrase/acetyltransferase-like protein (isoleucine patch superfamily)
VDVGAIVIVEAKGRYDENSSQCSVVDANSTMSFAGETLAFAELLGRSVLEQTLDRLLAIDVKFISLVVHSDLAAAMPAFRRPLENLAVRIADDPWSAVAQILTEYGKNGCDSALVAKPTAYIEADLPDLLDFHRQGGRSVTRACDREGSLDLWVMSGNPLKEMGGSSLSGILCQGDSFPSSYFVKEYVRRISHPEDFRRLITDAFLSRCNLHPLGEQRRPGIWADRDVEIRRGARIVGPAYLGARCAIGERAVITRFSNIEHDSFIDYGTVVESSSVLPNTYVGVWLDVRHSIVQGNTLLNLERGVQVEVCDPRLLRFNAAVRQTKRSRVTAPEPKHETSRPRASIVDRIRSINTTTEFES